MAVAGKTNMRRPLLITLLLLVAALAGGFWPEASALVRRWDASAELQVRPPAKLEARLGSNASFELHGEGLDERTRVWLVPEATQRLALAATIKSWGNPYQVQQRGNRVYVANGRGGVLVLDMRDWARPRLLGSLNLPKQALDLEVYGNLVFVACGEAGLQVADFSDPTSPRLLATLDLPGSAIAVHLRGSTLYIAGGKAGLLVLDVADPAHPSLMAQVDSPSAALDVNVIGDCAWLACSRNGVARYDITDPRRPQPLAGLARPGVVRCLTVSGTLAFVGSFESKAVSSALLSIYDCGDPARPRLLTEQVLAGDPLSMQIHQQRLVVAQGFNGVGIFDIANPERPQLLDSVGPIGSIRGALAEGDWLLLVDGTGFLHTMRRSDRLHLPHLGSIPSHMPYGQPLLQEGRLLTPLRNQILRIYSVLDPARPIWQADLPLPGNTVCMMLRGDLLLVSVSDLDSGGISGRGNLLVISLADAAHPQILSQLNLPAPPEGLAMVGTRAVLALPAELYDPTGESTAKVRGSIAVLDLSLPQRPIMLHQVPLDYTPTGLAWRDGYAFVSLAEGRLQSVRVPEQGAPELVGEVEFPWLHQGGGIPRGGIELVGGVAAVYTGASELSFVDVSSPSRPVLLGSAELPGFIDQLTAVHDQLYVGIISKGIMLYDLSLPWQPCQVGLLPLPWSGNSFVVSDDVLWYGGNTRLGLTCIPRPELVAARAEAEGTRLSLQLPSPLAAGDYSLWVERDNHWQEIPNSVRFNER